MTMGSSTFLCLGRRTFSGEVVVRIEVGVSLLFIITVRLFGVERITITLAGSIGIGIAGDIALAMPSPSPLPLPSTSHR